jgi:hypothetical protein
MAIDPTWDTLHAPEVVAGQGRCPGAGCGLRARSSYFQVPDFRSHASNKLLTQVPNSLEFRTAEKQSLLITNRN